MEYNVLMEMHKKIDECASKGIFKNRFVVIFGSNEPAERIMEYLTEKGITVNGLIDNNSKKKRYGDKRCNSFIARKTFAAKKRKCVDSHRIKILS